MNRRTFFAALCSLVIPLRKKPDLWEVYDCVAARYGGRTGLTKWTDVANEDCSSVLNFDPAPRDGVVLWACSDGTHGIGTGWPRSET